MSDRPLILVISEDAEFEKLDDDIDTRYGQYIKHFSKSEVANKDFRFLVKPPVEGALKGWHADLVLLEADVEEEFYDRYVKTRVSRKNGAVIRLGF